MKRLSAVLLLVLALSVTVAPASAQVGGACGQSVATTADGQIVLTGEGKLNSRPFDLQATAYTVRWAGTAPSKLAPGNLLLVLKRTDGPYPQELLVNTLVNKGDADVSGETQVYLTKGGAHYLDVMAPASWTVTITPQV